MTNLVALIPARAGSKSIPNKNIKLLGGKPLISYTIESAFKAGIERVIVSTDGEEIAKVAREYGAEVLMRPPELAEDNTSMFAVLKSEIPKIEPLPEFVIVLQPTTPFRERMHIRMAIEFLAKNWEKYDSLIAVERVPEKWNPAQVIVSTPLGHRMASGAKIAQRITQRQSFPEAWVPTGSLYLFKTSNLEKGSIYGNETMLVETSSTININSPDDWGEAEKLIKK